MDTNEFIEAAKATQNKEEIDALLWRKNEDGYGHTILFYLRRQEWLSRSTQWGVYSGWFNEIIDKLTSTNVRGTFYNLDFVNFHLKKDAALAFNNSLVVKDFLYYIYRSTSNNGFNIDIKQDVLPNLTELIWLFSNEPTITKADESINLGELLPPNPLPYARKIV